MKNNAISRISMAAIPIMIVCVVLAGASASAQSDTAQSGARPCSNRTLFGDYASAIDGLILPAPGVILPIRGINLVHFDGKGNSTQLDSLILNGIPISDWTPVTGTYYVNVRNCGIPVRTEKGRFLRVRSPVSSEMD